jgi:hypothetical protein
VTQIKGDDKWFTVCSAVLTAASNGLTLPVNRYVITTSQIAWDDCCAGQLAVSLTRTAPTESFPTEAVTLVGSSGDCVPPYETAEITVQITRCAPQALNGKDAPTPDALTQHAKQNMIDANQIKHAVSLALCALKADFTTGFDYFVRSQLFLGPEGACDGSELYLYAGLAVG